MNKTIQRLNYLSTMLNKYGHCWGENPSARMYSWVDEYNGIKEEQPAVWKAYCEQYGFTLCHDAADCMA